MSRDILAALDAAGLRHLRDHRRPAAADAHRARRLSRSCRTGHAAPFLSAGPHIRRFAPITPRDRCDSYAQEGLFRPYLLGF
ncbi:MAG TPA: hypothetical protein VKI45_02755, partial [Allosphingosinicella sp.]|nr:hypothetical protein [Allosphingosinicella sp.]